MSDAIEEKRPNGFWAGLIFVCIEIILILVFLPNSWIEKSQNKESEWMVAMMGVDGANSVLSRANDWYHSVLIDSGLSDTVHDFFVPSEEEQARAKGMDGIGEVWAKFISNRGDAVAKVLAIILTRLSHLLMWAPFLLVLVVPSFLDGYMTWKVKRTNFDYSSPFLNRYGHQLALVGVMLVLIGIILPAPVPPLVFPSMSLVLIPLVGLWIIGNLPKRI